MTQEEIIRMAREAGFAVGYGSAALAKCNRLIELAKSEEREACANIADWFKRKTFSKWPDEIADAIRERGQQ